MSGQDDEVHEVVDLTTTVVDLFPQKPQNLDDDVVYVETTKAPPVVSPAGKAAEQRRKQSELRGVSKEKQKKRFGGWGIRPRGLC